MDINKEWLESLIEGNMVFIETSRSGSSYDIGKVSKVTKTQITVIPNYNKNIEVKFRRGDGRKISSDRWNSSYLVEPTEERVYELNVIRKQRKLKKILESVIIPNTIDELNIMINTIEPFTLTSIKENES